MSANYRLDLMRNVDLNSATPMTAWTPTIPDVPVAFASCLRCGATLMYWYDGIGTVDLSAVDRHWSFHDDLDQVAGSLSHFGG